MNLGFAAGVPVIPPPIIDSGDGVRGGRIHYESEDERLRKKIEEQTKQWEIFMRVYSEYRKMN